MSRAGIVAIIAILLPAICGTGSGVNAFARSAFPEDSTDPTIEEDSAAPDPETPDSAPPAHALSAPVHGGLVDVRRVVLDALRASGIEDPAAIEHYRALFEERIGGIVGKLEGVHSPYRRARRLHEALHKGVLLRYKPAADGLNGVLDRGEYNCVSATLTYGIAARALGLDPRVVEGPRHIFIRLEIDDRTVDIETTQPQGFDLSHNMEAFKRFALAYKWATPEELQAVGTKAIFEEFHGLEKPVTLELATAYLWHNTGERALERGDAPRAVRAFHEEFHLHPDLVRRTDSIGVYMARMFRMEYDEGRFDSAYAIAAIELEMFPTRTTAHDRFLAAASKRILAACDRGSPSDGEAILGDAAAAVHDASDTARLEREVCPRIAAAAVRTGDWARATRMAERFAASEPDEIEGMRFLSWVENRRLEGAVLPLEEVCPAPRRSVAPGGAGIYGRRPDIN